MVNWRCVPFKRQQFSSRTQASITGSSVVPPPRPPQETPEVHIFIQISPFLNVSKYFKSKTKTPKPRVAKITQILSQGQIPSPVPDLTH